MSTRSGSGDRRSGRRLLGIVAGLLLLAAAGCDSILEVELPGRVEEETLEIPELAGLIVNSAIADVECAYSNFTAAASAQTTETWHVSGNQVAREWGLRLINENQQNYTFAPCDQTQGFGVYTVMQTARFQGERAIGLLNGWSDEEVPGSRDSLLAVAQAYTGYAYVMLGEPYCSMAIDGGSRLDPDEVLGLAEDHFTEAIDHAEAADVPDILNMALVGRARVRLDRGMDGGAVADAGRVPDGYAKHATRSTESVARWNDVFQQYTRNEEFTIAPGFRNLEWKGVEDPRTAVTFNRVMPARGDTEHWSADKYPGFDTNIDLATWEEAQLIIAEAEGGQTAVGIINELHSRAGLPPFDPDTDATPGPTNDNILNHVLQERSREFFLEGGHRLNDHLRYDIPFFTGTSHLGRQYGTTTCWPLPDVEVRGNDNIGG